MERWHDIHCAQQLTKEHTTTSAGLRVLKRKYAGFLANAALCPQVKAAHKKKMQKLRIFLAKHASTMKDAKPLEINRLEKGLRFFYKKYSISANKSNADRHLLAEPNSAESVIAYDA